MKAAWLGILLCLGFSVGPCRMSAAPDSERELDARFVGCWKYATVSASCFSTLRSRMAILKRSMYERGKFMFASRGKCMWKEAYSISKSRNAVRAKVGKSICRHTHDLTRPLLRREKIGTK